MISEKQKIIENILNSGKVYYNPEEFLLVTRFTTQIMVNPLDKYNDSLKKELVADAINYQGDKRDYAILDLLDSLKKQEERGKLYQLLGLYLYLADEVSRVPNKDSLTFLEAARETKEDFEKKYKEEKFPVAGKKNWLVETLKTLNLYKEPHIRQLVEDWYNKGCYYVGGELHYQDYEDGAPVYYGTYTKLAQLICDPKKQYAQISDCISRALGVKELYIKVPPEEAFEITKKHLANAELFAYKKVHTPIKPPLLQPKDQYSLNKSSKKQININEYYIEEGHKTRARRAFRKIDETLRNYNNVTDNKINEDAKEFLTKVLEYFPTEVLNAVKSLKYRFVFSSKDDLYKVYPTEDLAGLSHSDCEAARRGFGNRNSRHNIAFFAKGKDRDLNPEYLAQTALHECVHIILNSNSVVKDANLFGKKNSFNSIIIEGKISSLFLEAADLYEKLSDSAKLKIRNIKSESIGGQSLGKILDTKKGERIEIPSWEQITIDDTTDFFRNYKENTIILENRLPDNAPQTDKDNFKAIYEDVYDKDFVITNNKRICGEEICANIFGLLHTEFAKDKNLGSNPFHPSEDKDFEPIWQIANKINLLIGEAVNKIQNKQKNEIWKDFIKNRKINNDNYAVRS